MILAHTGQVPAPHDIWSAWNLDPLLIAGLVLTAWVYRRGLSRGRAGAVAGWRTRCFVGALIVIGAALLSPLEAASAALASAHMVQHILLVLVAAPLLALSTPSSTILRGTPLVLRRAAGRWRRRFRVNVSIARFLRDPAVAWLVHVGALWFWHAAGPYGAALRYEPIHALEHASFLGTGMLFWYVVIGSRAAHRVSPGVGVLLVFGMSLQSVFLSVLLTFAHAPWYPGYATTTQPWSLDPLADQQLAGVIMWIPGGLVYVAAALTLLVVWIRQTEDGAQKTSRII